MDECGVCQRRVVINDDPLLCSGKCGTTFHRACTTLTKSGAKLIAEHRNMLFKCDRCLNDDESALDNEQSVKISHMLAMKNEMKKQTVILESFNGIRDSITAQIDSALEKGMDDMKRYLVETFQSTLSNILQNSVASKLEEIMKLNSDKKETERETPKADDFSYASVVNSTNSNQKSNKNSNNSNEKSNKKTKERKARPVIVIKPTESKQSNDDTRIFLKTSLDPKVNKVRNFRNGKDGSIIVECATDENIAQVKNDIESKLGQNYTAVVPTLLPKVKVVGMSDQYASEKFIELLKSQNENITIGNVKVVAEYENPRMKYTKYNVVLEVDEGTFAHLMTAKKVNIGWDRCPVYEAINVLRCFKCGEFGHKSTDCTNIEKCSKCSLQHKTSDCRSTESKCVNCIKANSERKMNLNVSHPAYSSDCPVFKRFVNKKKSNMYTYE